MISPDELRRLYVDELRSPVEIAQACHCTPETIRNRLKAAGVTLRTRSQAMKLVHTVRPDNIADARRRQVPGHIVHEKRIRELWATDLPNTEIGQMLGVAPDTIRYWGHKLGLPRRSDARCDRRRETQTPPPPKFAHRSVITFLPESARLEMEFRRSVAAARMWRMWS